MRLAENETAITVGGETFHCRPTLRAAFRLERKYSGFDRVIASILDGSVSAMADVVAESSDDPQPSLAQFFRALERTPLLKVFAIASGPVLNIVAALAGMDEQTSGDAPKQIGKRVTFAEYHAQLYQIATGWLGWTPDVAWKATAAEITEAYKGRSDMIAQTLKAVFGSPDTGEQQPQSHSEDQVRSGLAALKAMALSNGNRAV